MVEDEGPFALEAWALDVLDFGLRRCVDELGERFITVEAVVGDLPGGGRAALVLPTGNPLVLHLSESVARDLRIGLEAQDTAPAQDAIMNNRKTWVKPVPASRPGVPNSRLLGFEVRALEVGGATLAGYADEHGRRFVEAEVFVRDLPTEVPLAFVLPEGNPLAFHIPESLARQLQKHMEDIEWWAKL